MNPRIIKEVRLLVGPWCLMVVAALLPLFGAAIKPFHEVAAFFCGFAFFAGIPFLAALSLGGEFQQRTISLLFGQPVGRMQIWREKQGVLVVALLAALPFFWVGWSDRNELNGEALAVVAAWLLATVCSATFWTLLTRSTLGGLAIGQVVQFLVGAVMVNVGARVFGLEPSATALKVAEVLGAAICLGYSGVMLGLGLRKLARFQATGGIAGDDLLMVGPRMVPRALGELLRCRTTGATANLIRKELRMLRPLWLLTLLFLVCWVCIVITFRVIPATEEWKEWRQVIPALVLCLDISLSIMLAGCLSLGEERTSGTHDWHLTLPVSARRQWFIKLVMALGAGVFCGLLVPLLAVSLGQLLMGSPFGAAFKWDFPSASEQSPLLLALFASFPAFWCACAVKGTVRAALWTLPVMCALSFAGAGGIWLAEQCGEITVPLMTRIIARFQLNPLSLRDLVLARLDMWVLWLVFPTLLVAIFQSYRLFRMPPRDQFLRVIQRVMPLALLAYLGGLSGGAFLFSLERQRDSILVRETRSAIGKLQIDPREFNEAHPLKVSVDDLAKVSPMSELTRQWLRNATLTVYPVSYYYKHKKVWGNAGIVRFPDGSDAVF